MASGEMSEAEFRSFLADTLGAAARVSRDGAVHFVCMDWRHMDDVSAVGRTVYGERLNLCIWNKSNAGMGSLFRSKHELIFVYRVGTAPHLNMVELGRHGRNRTNVWDYASVNSLQGGRREDLALHPTVKPTGLVADAILDVTRRGDLVLDLFLGSGTTLLAAERTGRRFRGLDIDPAYVDVAIDRLVGEDGSQAAPGGADVMSGKSGSGKKTPNPGWFSKGSSPNPGGRPAASPAPQTSAFEVLLEKTLTVTDRTGTREISIEETLQQQTYQRALKGERVAVREVLKWIMKRDTWLAKNAPKASRPAITSRISPDPDNADAALLLLGIAAPNPARAEFDNDRAQLLLEPWAAQAALHRRRGGQRLTDEERDWIRRCTRDPDSLRWPRGTDK